MKEFANFPLKTFQIRQLLLLGSLNPSSCTVEAARVVTTHYRKPSTRFKLGPSVPAAGGRASRAAVERGNIPWRMLKLISHRAAGFGFSSSGRNDGRTRGLLSR
ncbi:unnamed protein product [Pleuronectes platessa]|uniref:Uncharacterized protein n=1 Tax=Pleuronectes platessa TaxID=8262 RepID=A0A9N7TUD4_PLEPL|nr:unnamed protein product [Pleuronectes platessa]